MSSVTGSRHDVTNRASQRLGAEQVATGTYIRLFGRSADELARVGVRQGGES